MIVRSESVCQPRSRRCKPKVPCSARRTFQQSSVRSRAIMSRTRLICICTCLLIASFGVSSGATIPAGAVLVARTLGSISSHAKPGGVFTAKLDHSVVVNGKAVLPAGTRVLGVVEASRGDRFRTSPLILDLTGISLHGKTVPVTTTGGFQPEVKAKTARQARAGFSVGESNFPADTRI